MKILHVVALIQASTGGPAVSVTRLASEQAKMGHEVTLACLDYPHLGPQIAAPGVRLVSVKGNVFAVRGRGWSPRFRRVLMEEARNADVVHNHGLWMWPNAHAREAAVAAGKPLIISPRGMLEAWSLNRSKLRKAVAWRLFEKKNLQSAAMFHATSEQEAQSIRQAASGIRQTAVPIVVAANGVDLPDLARRPGRQVLENRFPQLKDRRWIVFMSRLHPKKGVDVLLRAWARQKDVASGSWRVASGKESQTADGIRQTTTETKRLRDQETKDSPLLVLAGSDLIGYRKDVERMVKDLGLEDSVLITGEVLGNEKDCLLANADVFVLPSYSENFGIVVAEAMSWGRPVIASTGTPWKEIVDVGAGWWVKPEEEPLTQVLHEALTKRPDELDSMGAKGRALVAERYTWAAPAAKLLGAYEELLAKGNFQPQPSGVNRRRSRR
jgi:glycosyltransferase involved in cell wall biosynthesis